ncbi:chaperonin 10-like protein [Aspergillus avenaceus]|uniref:Chaperonin 10-like protein n=1 Tax=Aspergillus avenaceus TaxID=36643 RepID=A0A5N6TTV7_ASPAV|nr:chaperonin 10-like protein [Aspergillus avenaceus]
MTVPDSFLAAVVPEPGAANVVANRSCSALDAGEVAIKITATAINPVDWKARDYWQFFKGLLSEYPAVFGSDAAGEVVAIGPNVSTVAVGDRVFFQGMLGKYDSCTFQQYCKMPAALVSKTPANISDDQAAGVSLALVAGVTAFYDAQGYALAPPWDREGPQAGKGKAVVIIGGASSVGQYAIQLARLSGFEKIVTNASPANHDLLRQLGAHVVLDRSQSTPEAFQTAIGGLPLAFIFDAISAEATQDLGVDIHRAMGTTAGLVLTVNPAATKRGESDPRVEINMVLGLGSSLALRYLSEPMVKHLGGEDGYLARGLIVPNRVRVVPGGLGAVEQALGLNKAGVSGEKLIVRPFE